MNAQAGDATIWQRLLWMPPVAAVGAGLLFLVEAIDGGTVLLIASVSWLSWWIAALVLGLRSRSSATPPTKSAGYSLLIGCAVTYGVIWGVSLI